MGISTILLIILILLLLGAIPAWPHSRGWGYGPSGGLGLVVLILLILLLMGRILSDSTSFRRQFEFVERRHQRARSRDRRSFLFVSEADGLVSCERSAATGERRELRFNSFTDGSSHAVSRTWTHRLAGFDG